MHQRFVAGILTLLAGSFALSGCASRTSNKPSRSQSGSSSSTALSGTEVPSIAAMVPAKLRAGGALIVATDASYAPNEFFAANNTTIEGMDIDLGRAVAAVLGVKFNFVNASFDTILPALGTRFDISMSSLNDTKAREAEVNMVTYFQAGAGFMVKKGTDQDLTSLAALCGKNVAVEKGTTQLDDATAQSAKCKSEGKSAIDVQAYPDQNGATLALNSGRADVVLADTPVLAYAVRQSGGAFELIGNPYNTLPYGIPVPKGSVYAGLDQALLAALKHLASDGTYLAILNKWGEQGGAIGRFQINGASS
ncbi:MAG: ABC transporter substrate-binding protein [Jatrophihabitans sp.]